MSVKAFDVDFSIIVRRTGEARSVTRREYAEAPADAWMQTLMNATYDNGFDPATMDVRLIYIGPPRDVVEAIAFQSQTQVDEIMAKLKQPSLTGSVGGRKPSGSVKPGKKE